MGLIRHKLIHDELCMYSGDKEISVRIRIILQRSSLCSRIGESLDMINSMSLKLIKNEEFKNRDNPTIGPVMPLAGLPGQ